MSKTLKIEQQGIINTNFDISEAGEVIGTLSFKGISHSKVEAEMSGQQWVFEKKGFFRNKILVKKSNSDEIVATYQPEMFRSRGSLRFADSTKEYRYKSTSLWKAHRIWTDSQDTELILYKMGGILKVRGEAEVSDAGLKDHHYSLLLTLGVYINYTDDSDASGATIAGTSGGS